MKRWLPLLCLMACETEVSEDGDVLILDSLDAFAPVVEGGDCSTLMAAVDDEAMQVLNQVELSESERTSFTPADGETLAAVWLENCATDDKQLIPVRATVTGGELQLTVEVITLDGELSEPLSPVSLVLVSEVQVTGARATEAQ